MEVCDDVGCMSTDEEGLAGIDLVLDVVMLIVILNFIWDAIG